MQILHSTSLMVIAVTWLLGWIVGQRWCDRCGVHERVSRWALASIVPTAGLVLAVHLMAFAALFTGRGLVTPAPVAVIFLVWVGAGYRWFVRRQPAPTAAVDDITMQTQPKRMGYLWLPVAVLIGMYGVFLVDALSRYPTGYDGLYYHLPVAISWMRAQSLDLIPGLLYESLPENGILVPFLLSFAGLERLLVISKVPSGLLVAAVTYGLTRALGAGRAGGIAGVCVAMSIPMVVFQSFSTYVDLYGAASWLAALLALTWAARAPQRRQRRELLLLAGLSAGVALGSKSTYLVLVAVLGLAAMAVEWVRPRLSRIDSARPLRNLAVFAAAGLVCSSFWFTRGAVQAGNPVYPFQVKIAGHEVWPGFAAMDHVPERTAARKIARWWSYPWHETNYGGTGYPYSVNNALGAPYTMFVPLGIAAAVLSTFTRRPRDATEKWKVIFLGLGLIGLAMLMTVFTEVLRYVLPLALIGVPLAGVLIDRLIRQCPRATTAILTTALTITAAAATLEPARSFAGRFLDGRWDRSWFYQVPNIINELDPGVRIACLAEPPLTYPLLGNDLANVVISKPYWFHLLGGERVSARALYEHDVDYLYVREPWFAKCTVDLPLEKIYDDTAGRPLATTAATRIYRVLPAGQRAATFVPPAVAAAD